MNLSELRNKYKLIDLFVELCEIPSPPLKEEALSKRIIEIFQEYGVKSEFDDFGNVIAFIPASLGNENITPLLLSAHLDVVGGSETVNIKLSDDKKYIETDKTRTLGADNKAGIAVIMHLAEKLVREKINHGPIEITFTRDEEKGMTGARNLDTSKLSSKYAIIADGGKLGELDCEGAGFTNIYIKVSQGKGGHSGLNIHENSRVNAIKVLSEIDAQIPQGVFKLKENGDTITSINAGSLIGGAVDTYISEILKEAYQLGRNNLELPKKYNSANIMSTISERTALNVISTDAQASYSLRSSEPENEAELINKIKNIVNQTADKYKGLINIDINIVNHLLPFVKSEDTTLVNIITKAAKNIELKCTPGCFHAGAETHIFANEKKNAEEESFNPVIVGFADLYDIHSADERIDWQSFLKGSLWLEEIITELTKGNYCG